MVYHVSVDKPVADYLRSLEGLTRRGRLALHDFMNVLRDYGDEAREGCPRRTPDSTVFRLRWTFDAGPEIRSLDLYIDDSQGADGLVRILYADVVPLPEEE